MTSHTQRLGIHVQNHEQEHAMPCRDLVKPESIQLQDNS
jgi:hypothetical protein